MLLYGHSQEKEAIGAIAGWIKIYMERKIKSIIGLATKQRSKDVDPKNASNLTAPEILLIVNSIQEEIYEDKFFKDSLPRYKMFSKDRLLNINRDIDLMTMSTTTYYATVVKLVKEICERQDFPPSILDLYFKLKEFHNFLSTTVGR